VAASAQTLARLRLREGVDGAGHDVCITREYLECLDSEVEERLKQMAKELGYGLRRVEEPERPSNTKVGV